MVQFLKNSDIFKIPGHQLKGCTTKKGIYSSFKFDNLNWLKIDIELETKVKKSYFWHSHLSFEMKQISNIQKGLKY